MRTHHVIAIAIALVAGFGLHQIFFSTSPVRANADTVKSSSIDVSKIYVDPNLPTAKIHDMTFVFADSY